MQRRYSWLKTALVCFAFLGVSLSSNLAVAQNNGLESLLEELFGGQRTAPQAEQRPRGPSNNGRIILRTPDPENAPPELRGSQEVAPQVETGSSQTTRRLPDNEQQIQLSFAPLVRQTSDAVVNIFAARMAREGSPFANDPFFERFFNRRGGGNSQRQQNSLGSGVIIDKSGLIVTNNHVIADAATIRVVLDDGNEFQAKIVVRDEDSDLAILQIDTGSDLPTIPLGDADRLEVGDLVLAIGNPFGVGKTVTSGIVSAVARSRQGLSDFGFFIQTDAAINPGNSGGALINMQGELVGVNTAIFSRSGGSNGIGFAVPSNMVNAVLQAAASGESEGGQRRVARPYIGASFQPVTPDIAAQLGMRSPRGALIVQVEQNGPADEAGLQPGDVVLEVNGIEVSGPDALNYRLFTAGVGANVSVGVVRRGQVRNIDVVLRQEETDANFQEVEVRGSTPFAGSKVADMTPRILRRLRVRTNNTTGAIVTEVERGSVASRFVQPGDIIRAINGIDIYSVEDLRKMLTNGSRNWRYTIERRGRIIRQFVRR
jgi:Do/DeqQ family serine protease